MITFKHSLPVPLASPRPSPFPPHSPCMHAAGARARCCSPAAPPSLPSWTRKACCTPRHRCVLSGRVLAACVCISGLRADRRAGRCGVLHPVPHAGGACARVRLNTHSMLYRSVVELVGPRAQPTHPAVDAATSVACMGRSWWVTRPHLAASQGISRTLQGISAAIKADVCVASWACVSLSCTLPIMGETVTSPCTAARC